MFGGAGSSSPLFGTLQRGFTVSGVQSIFNILKSRFDRLCFTGYIKKTNEMTV